MRHLHGLSISSYSDNLFMPCIHLSVPFIKSIFPILNGITRPVFGRHRDSNLDRQSRRPARWPLDYHHGPVKYFFSLSLDHILWNIFFSFVPFSVRNPLYMFLSFLLTRFLSFSVSCLLNNLVKFSCNL